MGFRMETEFTFSKMEKFTRKKKFFFTVTIFFFLSGDFVDDEFHGDGVWSR